MVTTSSTPPPPSLRPTPASPERGFEPLLERSNVRRPLMDDASSPPPADVQTSVDGSLSAAAQTELQTQSSDAQRSPADAPDSLQHAATNFNVTPAEPVPALVGLGVIPKSEYRFSEKIKAARLRRRAIRTHGSGSPHR